jgi:hypothetical protein
VSSAGQVEKAGFTLTWERPYNDTLCPYRFFAYVTMLFQLQRLSYYRIVNDKLEGMWKEVVVVYLRYYTCTC